MARPIIASKLIKSVRNRALIPTDTSTYQDEDILTILNEEVSQGLLTTIMVLNEEHMVDHIDIPYDGSAIVKIPERAVGNKLRDVAYLRNGNVYELSRISLEELSDYRQDFNNSRVDVVYVEGDSIKFVTNSIQADKIRVYFYMSPNELVDESGCGQIFSVTDNGDDTTTVVFTEFPSELAGTPTIDIISNKVPNKIIGYDIEPISTNQNVKSMTFNNDDLPDGLAKNDWVCLQYTTPFVNLPPEMHPLLAQRAAVYILEALGDSEGLRNAMTRMAQMENSLQTILESRIEGAPQKINPRHSTLVETQLWGNSRKSRRGRY